MLRRGLTRASEWLLALAALAAVLALLVPSHAFAQRSDLVLAALVLFTALGIAPAQLATLTAHRAQLAVLVAAPFVALVPLAWLMRDFAVAAASRASRARPRWPVRCSGPRPQPFRACTAC